MTKTASPSRKPKPTGRPSSFTQETAVTICARLADGESLRSICEGEGLPTKTTVMRWLADDRYTAFRDQYARAREMQADALFDDILHIADTPLIGTKTKTTSDGKTEVSEGDMIEHRRLQVDARKWMAGKLQPKKYGEKTQLTGADGEGPVQVEEAGGYDLARRIALALSAQNSSAK